MDQAIEWFKLTKMPRWAVTFGDGNSTFAVSSDGATAETATEELRTMLKLFPARKGFKIDASPGAGTGDAKKHLFFTGTKEDAPVAGLQSPWGQQFMPPPPSSYGPAKEEIASMIAEAVTRARLEDELARLRAEVKLLQGENPRTATDAAISTLVGTINPYIPYLMFGGTPPAVAGIGGPTIVKSEEDATKQVADALERLRKQCDGQRIDLVDLLVKMANRADQNPAQIAMLNQMLAS